ncbi:hypothetical protein [Azospirillum doebereinerae]|uniref:Uncharacterized protein n=1 Tax=Azospirillum doebereinerae TaxID=92933 RepID=A0A3S0VHQ3_9PROT|nr:hypothetical protein [Azospirillum doebereinerae]RUQ69776.1 hypothetical protein EJ913_15560 [Azospirillum doebereinerae]
MSGARPHTGEPPARLYEAILHLRRLGHQVRKHENGARQHVLDGAVVSEAMLMELAMTRFRRTARAKAM